MSRYAFTCATASRVRVRASPRHKSDLGTAVASFPTARTSRSDAWRELLSNQQPRALLELCTPQIPGYPSARMKRTPPSTSLQRLRTTRGLTLLLLCALLLQTLTVSACIAHDLGEPGFSPVAMLEGTDGVEAFAAEATAPDHDSDARLQHAIGSCAHCACSHLAALPVQGAGASVSQLSVYQPLVPVLLAAGLPEQALRPPAAV